MVDESMQSTYSVLAKDILDRVLDQGDETNERPYWIGIAGGPGSGKSTLAEAVARRLNQEHEGSTIVLPMDGFHYSRAGLKNIAQSGTYTYEELLARRGSPWTFDAELLVDTLSRVKALGEGELPTYCRSISDPVPGGVKLLPRHKIILVEGNYLLNFEDKKWEKLRDLFDEKWFISCSCMEKQRERLIKRHLQTWNEEKTKMFGEGRTCSRSSSNSFFFYPLLPRIIMFFVP